MALLDQPAVMIRSGSKGNNSMSKVSRLSIALLILFVLSGFAGLLYQSVWSHYLGLSLGHAAYAQTLVLAIFMGGMAIGAWLASRYSLRWKRLILGYAVVEGIIGLLGLLFHPAFVAYTGISHEMVLPALGNATIAHTYQWLSATLLITPQTILLGATFPLMSAGLIRALPNEHGEVLGGLYFTNSLGAALGALLATFVLLPAVGLPGTILTAGILNIIVALLAWMLSKMLQEEGAEAAHVHSAGARDLAEEPKALRQLGRVLIWSTAVSGAASFVYEVGWVRLLNQALGTTIHSFELMLAAFIFGLAFGGLWVRKRAKHIREPVRYVGYVQIWMAIAALISIPVFTQSFEWVGWIMGALAPSDNGYTLYELATAAISLLVMFPAAFLAGMTLPLFTLALLREGANESAIGRIYAANTLGAIVGVAVMMHILIPVIGVRLGVTLGALVDGLVGVYLLRMVNPARLTKAVAGATLALVVALGFSVVQGQPDPLRQISGVFRTGVPTLGRAEVNYLKDGKTSTVALFTADNRVTISTNGKPDASLTPLKDKPTQDEITMIMAGALPLALHPDPKRVAVIGWGSGLTTQTLLGSALPKVVETIEIEEAMVEGAKLFGDRVSRAYEDPRSRVQIDDARTFFSTGARKYDVIVSEPSNPWVSGVASLFTREFYAFLKRHLSEHGVLVQWLHMYEIDDALVGTMMAALSAEFPHADLYLTNTSDLLIVARMEESDFINPNFGSENATLQTEMRRVGIDTVSLINVRRIGSAEVLRNFVRMTGAAPHSDFFPTVSLRAPKTRFKRISSTFLPGLVTNGLPVLDILDCRIPISRSVDVAPTLYSSFSDTRDMAVALVASAEAGRVSGDLQRDFPQLVVGMQALLLSSRDVAHQPDGLKAWSSQVATFARQTIGLLPAEDLQDVWVFPSWLQADALQIPEVKKVMDAYSAAARRSPVEMRANAEDVLRLPADVLSPLIREQMLVIAQLGALGEGDRAAVNELDEQWGGTVARTSNFVPIRSYLLAWADSGVPVCDDGNRH